jgi:hypothetical protein
LGVGVINLDECRRHVRGSRMRRKDAEQVAGLARAHADHLDRPGRRGGQALSEALLDDPQPL